MGAPGIPLSLARGPWFKTGLKPLKPSIMFSPCLYVDGKVFKCCGEVDMFIIRMMFMEMGHYVMFTINILNTSEAVLAHRCCVIHPNTVKCFVNTKPIMPLSSKLKLCQNQTSLNRTVDGEPSGLVFLH